MQEAVAVKILVNVLQPARFKKKKNKNKNQGSAQETFK
jgi:hypothetical protein